MCLQRAFVMELFLSLEHCLQHLDHAPGSWSVAVADGIRSFDFDAHPDWPPPFGALIIALCGLEYFS